MFSSGEGAETPRWFHVSRQELAVGTVLIPGGAESQSALAPGGAESSSAEFYDLVEPLNRVRFAEDRGTLCDMGAPRTAWVWLSVSAEDAQFWATVLHAEHMYEVVPEQQPRPWNGTGIDGWVCSRATVLGRYSG